LETRRDVSAKTAEQSAGTHLQPGQVLHGRYQILRVLGTGGMSAVYEARDLNFPNVVRRCAVKEITIAPTKPLVLAQQRELFEREANLLASLSHPAIPKIYDFFNEEEYSYLVLELIHGEDLETILRRHGGPLPQSIVVRWAIEICEVLHFLHTRQPEPIVFRDMKPSNVMLNEYGHIVLIDFGIAKIFRGEERGTMIGTEGYSPPEQYRGIATPQSDIYSLGATLHHLLSGCDPTKEAPFTFHQRPLRQYNPTVSSELEAIIMRALAYEASERFATAEEMRRALLPLAGRAGQPDPALFPTVRISSEPAVQPLWTFRCEDEVRSSPRVADGVLYIGCYDHNLYALRADSGQLLWKFPTEGGIAATPAPWEDLVIIGSEDGALYAVLAASGRQVWRFPTQGRVRSSARIAYNHAFFGSDDAHIYAVQARSGKLLWKAVTSGPVRSSPAIADEMLVVGSEDGYVYALQLQRGTLLWRYFCGGGVVSSPLLWEGMVIVGSTDRYLYALDVHSGWPVWRFRAEKPIISSPAGMGDTIYVGSADGNLYALESGSGRLRWKYSTGGQVNSSPAVAGEAVYVGSSDGGVYCLDARTGKLRWKFETQGPVVSSPLVHEGVVFIGSLDHHVYALPAAG